MAGTFFNSIPVEKSPQYAYVLMILCGGVAFVISQPDVPVPAWFSYALLAALFGCVWPDRAFQWAVWLCLPILLLIFFDVIMSGSIFGLRRNGVMFIRAFPAACVGAYIGSKLSVRGLAYRLAKRRPPRRQASSNGNGTSAGLVVREASTPLPVAKRGSSEKAADSERGAAVPLKSLQSVAHFKGLNTSLIKATQEGDPDKVKLLAAKGADVNAPGSDRWTPLMVAALGGDVEVIKALFGKGALPDASGSNKGWTPLMIATVEGHVEVVRALIERGARVGTEKSKGWTALRFAVSMGETKIAQLLLDAGAEVNLADHEGRTALMQAAFENTEDCVKALLEAGADLRLKDANGQTALMIARAEGHTKIIKLLKEAEAKASNGTHAPASILDDGNSYLYLLKEELEDGLTIQRGQHVQPAEDPVLRLLSMLQAVQEHIDAARKERELAPSEISHKLTLTLREAATLSGLPRQHLLEAIEKGKLKAQLIKQGWRINRSDLDHYIRLLSR